MSKDAKDLWSAWSDARKDVDAALDKEPINQVELWEAKSKEYEIKQELADQGQISQSSVYGKDG